MHTATTEIYTLSLHDALPISFAASTLTGPTSLDSCVIRYGGLNFATGISVTGTQPTITRCVIENNQRSEEHTSELQSLTNLVCRLLLEKKKKRSSTSTKPLIT